MAGALWSETVRNRTQFHSMIYPRLLALAERAWHKGRFEDEPDQAQRERMKKTEWEMFANTLGYKELARLDTMNIKYHIPVSGARLEHLSLVFFAHQNLFYNYRCFSFLSVFFITPSSATCSYFVLFIALLDILLLLLVLVVALCFCSSFLIVSCSSSCSSCICICFCFCSPCSYVKVLC